MTIEMKPMSLGGIFDRTFKLIGKTFKRNLIIASILLIPVSIIFAYGLQQFFSALAMIIKDKSFGNMNNTSDLSALFSIDTLSTLLNSIVIFFIAIIFYSLVELFAMVATMHVASGEMNAQPIQWQDAIRVTLKNKFLTAIGQSILQTIAIGGLFVIPYIFIFVVIATDSAPLILFCVFTFFAGYAAAIYLSIKWLFNLTVIASEDVGVLESFRRSASLVKSHWWRTLGIYLLLSMVASLAISMITTPISFIAMWGFISKYFSYMASLPSHNQNSKLIVELLTSIGWTEGIVIAISAVLQLLVTPLIFVVMYFDLRARHGEFGPAADGPDVPYNLVPPTS